jgi:hypothetical protein
LGLVTAIFLLPGDLNHYYHHFSAVFLKPSISLGVFSSKIAENEIEYSKKIIVLHYEEPHGVACITALASLQQMVHLLASDMSEVFNVHN